MNARYSGGSFDLLGLRDLPIVDPVDEEPPPERPPQGWRQVLGWSGRSAPVAVLLLMGFGLGPHGINLLSPVMPLLDPAVPVALAALGVLAGLGLGNRRGNEWRLFGAAGLHSLITMLTVAGGLAALVLTISPVEPSAFWIVILVAGICAATSLTLPSGDPLEPRPPATRIQELGVLLPIVCGGLALAWIRAEAGPAAIALVGMASLVTVMLAAAAWLLLTRATSDTEERVFGLSGLLLVGGVADALSLSALFCGLVAGAFWRVAGRQPRESIRRDVLFIQHPLLVLVLLLAGARAEWSPVAWILGAAYLVLRVLAQFAGRALVRRVAGDGLPAAGHPDDLGRKLLPPGVFGVAFALNAVSVIGPDAAVAHAAVVVGTIGSELVAVALRMRRRE